MKYYLSYATNNWKKSQQLAESKAYLHGADKVISSGPKDLNRDFISKNVDILSKRRGGGYWLWKPYLILKTLNSMEEQDLLIYSDSGAHAISDLDKIYSLVSNKDIALFELHDKKNVEWTSKDCCDILGCNDDEFLQSNQVCATFQVYRKTQKSVEFVENYLNFCQNKSAILDSDKGVGLEYIEHRHDQSILSCLAFLHQIELHRDPSQWGNGLKMNNSHYDQTFHHHRGNL